MRYGPWVFGVLLSLLTLECSPDEGARDAQIRQLLEKVRAHQDEIDKQLENFGYIQRWIKEEGGKQKRSEISETTFYRNRKVSRLISRNGKALEGADLAHERRRVERQVRDLENGNARALSNRRVRIEDLLRASVFTEVRTTTLDGREVWYAEFHPAPNFRPANANERFAHNLDGKLWIDPHALQMARIEFALRDSFNIGGGLWFSMRPGTRFDEEETWAFSKIWLPKVRHFEMRAKAMMGVKLSIRETTEFSEFHEFDVKARDSEFELSH